MNNEKTISHSPVLVSMYLSSVDLVDSIFYSRKATRLAPLFVPARSMRSTGTTTTFSGRNRILSVDSLLWIKDLVLVVHMCV